MPEDGRCRARVDGRLGGRDAGSRWLQKCCHNVLGGLPPLKQWRRVAPRRQAGRTTFFLDLNTC